jgi:hypothetical protein
MAAAAWEVASEREREKKRGRKQEFEEEALLILFVLS